MLKNAVKTTATAIAICCFTSTAAFANEFSSIAASLDSMCDASKKQHDTLSKLHRNKLGENKADSMRFTQTLLKSYSGRTCSGKDLITVRINGEKHTVKTIQAEYLK